MKTYNVKLIMSFTEDNTETEEAQEGETEKKFEFSDHGIVYEEGRKCSMKGAGGVSDLIKISEEELEEIMNDFDPIEAPPGPYKVQPEKPGKESVS